MKNLKLSDWRLCDCSVVGGLTQLRGLHLSAPMSRLLDVSQLVNLEELSGETKELHNFHACHKLKKLYLGGSTGEPTLEGVAHFKMLEVLELRQSSIIGIGNVIFPNLREVILKDARKLETLNGIEHNQNLERFIVHGARSLRDISSLRKLTKLGFLLLEDCGMINSLEALRGHQGLEELYLIGKSRVEDPSTPDLLQSIPNLKRFFVLGKGGKVWES